MDICQKHLINEMPELWKPIPGYEGIYEVSNKGRIRSLARFVPNPKNGKVDFPVRAKIRKPFISHNGYLRITLSKNGHEKKFFVHRLVMAAFSPNPNPKYFTQINHKNEITNDNRLENLEWCTQTYNNNYGHRTQKAAEAQMNDWRSIKVAQFDIHGKLIRIWPSVHECERHGFFRAGVLMCNKGICETYKGYKWKYLN